MKTKQREFSAFGYKAEILGASCKCIVFINDEPAFSAANFPSIRAARQNIVAFLVRKTGKNIGEVNNAFRTSAGAA